MGAKFRRCIHGAASGNRCRMRTPVEGGLYCTGCGMARLAYALQLPGDDPERALLVEERKADITAALRQDARKRRAGRRGLPFWMAVILARQAGKTARRFRRGR